MDKSQKQIFVIDDDVSIGDILTNILESQKYQVQTFTSGREAIFNIGHKNPDLVLLDYLLPGENTQMIAGKIKKEFGKDVPIVLMSASTRALDMATTDTVSEFIPKPFQLNALLDVVERNIL